MNEYLSALIGGLIIGLAATILLLFKGRVFGISGILAGIIKPVRTEWLWRLVILLGLVVGGFITLWLHPEAFPNPTSDDKLSLVQVVIAGLLVGFGTQLGGGCTSGHGVCGISRLSVRSIVATLTFMASGIVTVFLLSSLGGMS